MAERSRRVWDNMGVGQVRLRENGFASSIGHLNRLRSSLKLDRRLDRADVAQAIRSLDELIDCLSILTHSLQDQKIEETKTG